MSSVLSRIAVGCNPMNEPWVYSAMLRFMSACISTYYNRYAGIQQLRHRPVCDNYWICIVLPAFRSEFITIFFNVLVLGYHHNHPKSIPISLTICMAPSSYFLPRDRYLSATNIWYAFDCYASVWLCLFRPDCVLKYFCKCQPAVVLPEFRLWWALPRLAHLNILSRQVPEQAVCSARYSSRSPLSLPNMKNLFYFFHPVDFKEVFYNSHLQECNSI